MADLFVPTCKVRCGNLDGWEERRLSGNLYIKVVGDETGERLVQSIRSARLRKVQLPKI